MATNTYVAIETQTLTSAVSSVTLGAGGTIPQGYTDLVLVASLRGTAGAAIKVQFNGDTGTNYSLTRLVGTGATAESSRQSNSSSIIYGYNGIPTASNEFAAVIMNIQNYSNTTTNKTMLSRFNNANSGSGSTDAIVGLWRNTAAITSVKVEANSGNFEIGSTFTLYGIANSDIGAPKAFGGTITQDANYTYHTFGASGTFTPQQSLTCDYLVVAGGAGGASALGGGGGAGGLRSTVTATGGGGSLESALSLTAQAYTVTIGAGGVGGISGAKGTSGSNSVFDTITSTGGGAGGSQGALPSTGGSGGGGAAATATKTGATGTANQGFAGGDGANTNSGNRGGAGGGGAGAIGLNGSTAPVGGNGGAGVAVAITGSSVTYAGGGGGGCGDSTGTAGTGGSGGGGNGTNNSTTASAGTVNLGGGGGAGGRATGAVSGDGGAGGSGIVIIRYAN